MAISKLARLSLTLAMVQISSSLAQASSSLHLGLLTNREMQMVLDNARKTQRLLLPEQKLSACWPYDSTPNDQPIGTALCTLNLPNMQNGAVHLSDGPDLYCSYTQEEFCDVRDHKG